MTNGLNATAIKILTWLIYGLMTLLTIATSYLLIEQAHMSERFVRLERYQSDAQRYQIETKRIDDSACRLESKFESFSNRIEDKIDVLILKTMEGDNKSGR